MIRKNLLCGICELREKLFMGIYLNPGNENFNEMVNAKIYVDKTMMIDAINNLIKDGNKYICISRPRRFGKTMAANMLSAYYSKGCDSSDIFRRYKISGIAGYEEKLNKFNVIKIDMNSEYQNTRDRLQMIKRLSEKIKAEMRTEFPDVDIADDDSIADSILKVYSKDKKNTFVIIIDEYDALVREEVEPKLFDEFLSFLNGLFKSDTVRPAITLAYITGIMPVVRDKIQSKLNNFEEYTILDAGELVEYVGFTSEEVKKLCDEYGMSFEECRRWYDGYYQHGLEIFNPESVVKSMLKHRYDGYWGKTSTYEVIAERIRQNFAGTKEDVIRMMAGESIRVNVTTFLNTMNSFRSKEDAFTYLIHLGYLAYDMDESTWRIPNREIRLEWENAISVEEGYETTNAIIKASEELLTETWNGNEIAVAKALDDSHVHVTSNRSYNNEYALQSAIYLAYLYALNKYNVFKELTTGKGFADVVYVPVYPDIPAMIIELKHNKSAETALTQIKDKKYFDSLSHYTGNLLFVGINYDEDKKTHECKIERFVI